MLEKYYAVSGINGVSYFVSRSRERSSRVKHKTENVVLFYQI